MGRGRGTRRDEKLIADVVNKSWAIVLKILTGKGYKQERKEMVALEVVRRTAPRNIDLNMSGRIAVDHATQQQSNQLLSEFLQIEQIEEDDEKDKAITIEQIEEDEEIKKIEV